MTEIPLETDMEWTYTDTITLDDDCTIGALDSVMETLRGVGAARLLMEDRKIEFTVEAQDLWDMHELLDEVTTALSSWGFHFDAEKALVKAL